MMSIKRIGPFLITCHAQGPEASWTLAIRGLDDDLPALPLRHGQGTLTDALCELGRWLQGTQVQVEMALRGER